MPSVALTSAVLSANALATFIDCKLYPKFLSDLTGSSNVSSIVIILYFLIISTKHEPSKEVLPEEIQQAKNIGGLNNDWDLTYFIIQLLFTLVDKPPQFKENKSGWDSYRRGLSRCNVSGLAKYLKTQKSPLGSLLKMNKKPLMDMKFEDIWIEDYNHDPFIKFPIAV